MVDRNASERPTSFPSFVVTDTSPLRVSLDGNPTTVRARRLDGQTLAVGDSGIAIWVSGTSPVCLKTV